jgi:hypothetical protein
MAITLIPYGQLSGGKYGIQLNDVTGVPIVTAVEVFGTDPGYLPFPAAADPDNFNGRMGYDIVSETLYVYQGAPINDWFPLEGIPADVGAVAGSPPVFPVPITGFLFFDTDTEVMFVWDGAVWQPIGGRFAARYIEQVSVSNGIAGPGGDTFALGTVPIYSEFVEVFLDGIRQVPNPGGDYNIIGSNAVFPAPVPIGVEVYTRTLQSTVLETPGILQNTQISAIKATSTLFQTTFDTGQPGLDPAGTFVFLNGVLQCGGGVDYVHSAADTTITSIIRSAATTATVTTLAAHGASVGSVVTIFGAAEAIFNGTVTIIDVPSTTVFKYTLAPGAPASATPNPILFYDPPFVNDQIIFTLPLPAGELVNIRALQGLVSAPSSGEANTTSNTGGGIALANAKVGIDLPFKTLVAGANILLTDLVSTVQISTTAGSTFEGYVATNSNYVLASTESYIGVDTSGGVIAIDVSTAITSGRRVVITDETGDAGTFPINITHTARLFSGAPSPLLVNVDYGSVTIVFDGTNWHVTSKTF